MSEERQTSDWRTLVGRLLLGAAIGGIVLAVLRPSWTGGSSISLFIICILLVGVSGFLPGGSLEELGLD